MSLLFDLIEKDPKEEAREEREAKAKATSAKIDEEMRSARALKWWAENNVPPANRPGMLPMLLPCLKRAKEHRARFHMVNDIERYTDLVFLPKINALIDLLNRTIYFCSPAEAA